MSVYHKSPFLGLRETGVWKIMPPSTGHLHHVFKPLVLDFKFEIPNALCYWYPEQVIFSKI